MLGQMTITQERLIESLKKIQERDQTGFVMDESRFPKLSDLVGSIRDSVVVGGVAGHGKSQLIQQITIHGALNGNKVLYCDFENPIEELHKTVFTKFANMVDPGSGPAIDDLVKDPEHIVKSFETQLETLQRYFYILKPSLIDTGGENKSFHTLLEEIIPQLTEIPGKDTIAVIDSFDELFKTFTRSNRPMTEIADFWVERLRSLKEKYGITVILICEYTKSDQTHKEYAAKWSSSIGHFARLNLFIRRPDTKDGLTAIPDSRTERRILEVIRNQYGTGTGSINLLFDTKRLIFREVEEKKKYE